jgi:sialate O-acetylesterase
MKISKAAFLLICFSCCLSVQAKVVLPKIFSDNMVLQRDASIPVWGWAEASEKVQVLFNGQRNSATADSNGKWTVKLKPEKAGGPFELIVKGENTIQISNVLVGEVWLCSGQSNMEWTVGQSVNAGKELALADNPLIRHIKISKTIDGLPQDDFKEGAWKVSDPTTAREFSGVAYFFAQNIYKELKVPIGLINASWGGTNIETWISREGFESSDEFRDMISRMPKLDIDSLTKLKVSAKTRQVEAIQGARLDTFDSATFKELSFDDSRLPTLDEPELWEKQSLGEFDGVVWLRKTITLSADASKKAATLELSMIDDDDITFINGVRVGSTNGWNAKRKYVIPKGVLREGKNVIAIRVTDTGGGGGIYSDAADLRLVFDDSVVPLSGKWKFQVESVKVGTSENAFPSLAYNAMISPLVPYALRGILWYQGESNASRAYQYRKAFPLLISDWRRKWNMGNFPFYFVQLATFGTTGNSNEGSAWAELREAQTQTLSVSNTGMAVTTDIGNPKDIHPTNKQEVGKRLAAIALNRIYKRRMIDSGPTFKSMRIVGNKIIVAFENIGSGLMTNDKAGIAKGFEIAGSDQIFYEATATIQGDTVIISCDRVGSPLAVHFGWIGDASNNNLFNREGFPAVPFRTDEWKTVTKNARYQIVDLMQ